jgi:DNA-binding response OmpR family regulator
VRGLISRALEDEGISVFVAEDGQRGLDEAARVRPHVVILDVTLPALDSQAVAAGLRQVVAADVRIMVITADSHAGEKAQALGAFAYLQKPFDIDELVALVRRGLYG